MVISKSKLMVMIGILIVFLFIIVMSKGFTADTGVAGVKNGSNIVGDSSVNEGNIRYGSRRSLVSNHVDDTGFVDRVLIDDMVVGGEGGDMAEQLELTAQDQKARDFAMMTANMSISQMAKLQSKQYGKPVRRANGRLVPPYVEEERCEGNNICKTVIVNSNSGETVWDGNWSEGYKKTGIGKEVVFDRRGR